MAVNIGITVLLVVVGLVFANDVHLFWDDRTTLGNVVMVVAVGFLFSWIASALWQVWH